MNDRTNETTLHLVRHGHVHNPEDILYGRLPRYKLSALGREQAAGAARVLAARPLAAVYSSPQLRARQTAQIIAAAQPRLSVRRSILLAEVVTRWQGHHGGRLGKLFDFYGEERGSEDETIDDIYRRVSRLVEAARRRHRGEHVALVTHGDPIIIVRTGYAGLPLVFSNLRGPSYPGPGSITSLTFTDVEPLPRISYYAPAAT